jgi:hypothetical protein
MVLESTLVGPAGEHFVMSELLRRGFIAALAPQGVPNVDIVVTDTGGQRLCSIQVKSRRDIGADGGWHMGEKHESQMAENLYYCFIDFGKTTEVRPIVYVVPSKVVAEVLRKSHQKWLNTPGKRGQVRNDGKMRRFLPSYSKLFTDSSTPYGDGWLDQYRNAWHLLKLEKQLES